MRKYGAAALCSPSRSSCRMSSARRTCAGSATSRPLPPQSASMATPVRLAASATDVAAPPPLPDMLMMGEVNDFDDWFAGFKAHATSKTFAMNGEEYTVSMTRGEALDEATIYLELAKASGLPLFGSRVFQAAMVALQRLLGRRHPSGLREVPQETLLSALLRVAGEGSFAKLLRSPHGRARPDHAGGDFLGQRVLTDDGKVQLAPPELLAEAAALEARFEAERRDAHGLRLITKRFVKTHNSWTHNAPEYLRGEDDTNYLYMNPDDAKARGLAEGDLADVTTKTDTVRIPVKLLPDLMPGSVALPHGWGHQHARGLSVASKTHGVNVNLLSADGPEAVERVSGMARMTAIPVEVAPAEGALDASSWSGRPAAAGR